MQVGTLYKMGLPETLGLEVEMGKEYGIIRQAQKTVPDVALLKATTSLVMAERTFCL